MFPVCYADIWHSRIHTVNTEPRVRPSRSVARRRMLVVGPALAVHGGAGRARGDFAGGGGDGGGVRGGSRTPRAGEGAVRLLRRAASAASSDAHRRSLVAAGILIWGRTLQGVPNHRHPLPRLRARLHALLAIAHELDLQVSFERGFHRTSSGAFIGRLQSARDVV